MDVIKCCEKGVAIIAPAGRVDSYTCAEFENAVNESIAEKEKQLIFDLAGVEYISSAGLRVLLSTQKTLNLRGGEALLASPPEFVNQILNISGFVNIFKIFPDIERALEYFEQKKG